MSMSIDISLDVTTLALTLTTENDSSDKELIKSREHVLKSGMGAQRRQPKVLNVIGPLTAPATDGAAGLGSSVS